MSDLAGATIIEMVEFLLDYEESRYDPNPMRSMVNGKEHCLQAATRAVRDRGSDADISMALVHDLGRMLDEEHHGPAIARVMRAHSQLPMEHVAALEHHSKFQDGNSLLELGQKYGREYWFVPAMRLAIWDALSFDPTYPTMAYIDFKPALYNALMHQQYRPMTKTNLETDLFGRGPSWIRQG